MVVAMQAMNRRCLWLGCRLAAGPSRLGLDRLSRFPEITLMPWLIRSTLKL